MNMLTVEGDESGAFYEANKGEGIHLMFAKAVPWPDPMPENTRDWSIEHWGTERDLGVGMGHEEPTSAAIENGRSYAFQTATAPPFCWLIGASKLYPRLRFTLTFECYEANFRGELVAEQGEEVAYHSGTFGRTATRANALTVLEHVDSNPSNHTNIAVRRFAVADVRGMLNEGDNIHESVCELSESNWENMVDFDSLRDAVGVVLTDIAKKRARERIAKFAVAVLWLKRFAAAYRRYLHIEGGPMYLRTKERFEGRVHGAVHRAKTVPLCSVPLCVLL